MHKKFARGESRRKSQDNCWKDKKAQARNPEKEGEDGRHKRKGVDGTPSRSAEMEN